MKTTLRLVVFDIGLPLTLLAADQPARSPVAAAAVPGPRLAVGGAVPHSVELSAADLAGLPTSAQLQSDSERDTGVMLRGYFLSDRLEYRSAFLSGFPPPE